MQSRLLNLMSTVYTQEKQFAASFQASEPGSRGSLEHWTAKDNLAHIAAWRNLLAGNLEAVRSGRQPVRSPADDEVNAEFFMAHQHDSWEQVISEGNQAYETLVDELLRLGEAELDNPDYFPWSNGRPLWRNIAGTSGLHPLSHMCSYLAQSGQGAAAVAMYAAAMPQLTALEDSPAWQALVKYDYACICALSGDKTKAIQLLKESFALSTDLVEWSKKDNDLANLHSESEFKALYQ